VGFFRAKYKRGKVLFLSSKTAQNKKILICAAAAHDFADSLLLILIVLQIFPEANF
jgi:hypothetical protein